MAVVCLVWAGAIPVVQAADVDRWVCSCINSCERQVLHVRLRGSIRRLRQRPSLSFWVSCLTVWRGMTFYLQKFKNPRNEATLWGWCSTNVAFPSTCLFQLLHGEAKHFGPHEGPKGFVAPLGFRDLIWWHQDGLSVSFTPSASAGQS